MPTAKALYEYSDTKGVGIARRCRLFRLMLDWAICQTFLHLLAGTRHSGGGRTGACRRDERSVIGELGDIRSYEPPPRLLRAGDVSAGAVRFHASLSCRCPGRGELVGNGGAGPEVHSVGA